MSNLKVNRQLLAYNMQEESPDFKRHDALGGCIQLGATYHNMLTESVAEKNRLSVQISKGENVW